VVPCDTATAGLARVAVINNAMQSSS
jgi:hypothetical protein